MKNIIALFLLFSCFSFVLSAQEYKVTLSPEIKLPKSKVLQGHLHSNDSGHYLFFIKRKGLRGGEAILEKYDRKFKQKFSKTYKIDKKGVYSTGIQYFKDKFAWTMYEKNKKDDYIKYLLTPIDMKGKSSKPVTVAKFKYKNRKSQPGVLWQVSSDTSKILFVAEIDRNKRDEKLEAYVTVFDNEFNKLWDKKIKLPFTQRKGSTHGWVITNSGEVSFMAKIYEKNSKKESSGFGKKSKPGYKMKIYSISSETGTVKNYKLKLRDAFVRGSTIRSGKDNNLSCVGFFSDSQKGPLQGVFYTKIDGKTGETIFSNKKRFSPKELDSFGKKNTSKDRKSKDAGLDDEFVFKKVIAKDDGAIVAIAEENYVRVSTSGTGANTRTTYRYVSNSIVVTDIGADGKIQNVGIIPKRQTFATPIYGTHATLTTPEGELYFVYNDDKDNLKKNITDPDKIKRISSARDCVAVVTKLGENGKFKRDQMFGRKETKSLLMPYRSSQIDDNELFFFNLKAGFGSALSGKNNFRFGVLEIK